MDGEPTKKKVVKKATKEDEAPPKKRVIVARVVKKKEVAANDEAPKKPKRITKAAARASGFDRYVDRSVSFADVVAAKAIPTYDIEVSPDAWVLPNRAKFPTWVDKTFAKKAKAAEEAEKEGAAGNESCTVRADITLFQHQRFIKDYMQFHSPYRGILLFHGVGVGKSCTSIAAAEILSNYMDVVVMTPASIKDNYVGEVKKCGMRFYAPRQHWAFFPIDTVDTESLKKLGASRELLASQKGMWAPIPGRPSNFFELPREAQDMINNQVDSIINTRFQFINYNGLQRTHIEKLAENGNPFDNKVVVIDEVHNLISVIANGRLIGGALYKLLLQAKGAKLVLLSGTPIINYPHEIAYMINLITGPRRVFEAKASKDSPFDMETVRATLDANKYIDHYEVDVNSHKILYSFLPEGWARTAGAAVAREEYVKEASDSHRFADDEKMARQVVEDLAATGMKIIDRYFSSENTTKKFSTHDASTLPEKEEDFNSYFVDFDAVEARNKVMFMRRILGTVSYYSTYSPELYPAVSTSVVPLEMNDYQFSMYEKARGEERKKEKSSKFKKSGGGNVFKETGQVYRFYSRALCNFVFPEGIDRPFPSKLSQVKKEVDMDDDEDGFSEDMLKAAIEPEKKTGKDFAKEYADLVNKALDALEEGPYLEAAEAGKLSPKFDHIYNAIHQVDGSVLVYSQFRKVEGLGVFAMMLRKNGYAEFKIKKTGEEWDIDIDPEDYNKPKYIAFTGSNEESRVLLKIFNSDMDGIPRKIREKLELLGAPNNHRGHIIKVIMITKSGAEGISLKNIRQVHIIEPYWNSIRTDQVIGRAVRTCSHIDLPREDRNVHVYMYYMVASKKQIAQSFSLRTQDKGKTSDEYIFELADKKSRIINAFLGMMREAAVDCALNAKKHGGLKCFSFPVNIDEDAITFKHNIASDIQDAQYRNEVETNEWKGEVLVTKKGTLLVRRETGEVYDYDIYVDSKRLVKLGVLKIKEASKKK